MALAAMTWVSHTRLPCRRYSPDNPLTEFDIDGVGEVKIGLNAVAMRMLG